MSGIVFSGGQMSADAIRDKIHSLVAPNQVDAQYIQNLALYDGVVQDDATVAITAGANKIAPELVTYQNKVCLANITISAGAGTYSGAALALSNLIFPDPNKVLKIQGDTRDLAGFIYCKNEYIATAFSGSGSGAISFTFSGDEITVTGSVANPNFTGLAVGSKVVLVLSTDGDDTAEYTVLSVASNKIKMTASINQSPPQVSSFFVKPNVEISEAITIGKGCRVSFSGIYFSAKVSSRQAYPVAEKTSSVTLDKCYFSASAHEFDNCILNASNTTFLNNTTFCGSEIYGKLYLGRNTRIQHSLQAAQLVLAGHAGTTKALYLLSSSWKTGIIYCWYGTGTQMARIVIDNCQLFSETEANSFAVPNGFVGSIEAILNAVNGYLSYSGILFNSSVDALRLSKKSVLNLYMSVGQVCSAVNWLNVTGQSSVNVVYLATSHLVCTCTNAVLCENDSNVILDNALDARGNGTGYGIKVLTGGKVRQKAAPDLAGFLANYNVYVNEINGDAEIISEAESPSIYQRDTNSCTVSCTTTAAPVSTRIISADMVVTKIIVDVTVAYDNGATLLGGTSGVANTFIKAGEVDLSQIGLTVLEVYRKSTEVSAFILAISGTPSVGACTVTFEYGRKTS